MFNGVVVPLVAFLADVLRFQPLVCIVPFVVVIIVELWLRAKKTSGLK